MNQSAPQDTLNKHSESSLDRLVKGHVRIWEHSKNGFGKLILDKDNLITKEGASIAAAALAGVAGAGITHMYIGYTTSGSTTVTPTTSDTVASFTNTLALPIAFAPTMGSTSGYTNNIVYFTAYLTGEDLTRVTSLKHGDQINSLGLVNKTGLITKLFSRLAVTSNITYASDLAITWGITFSAV